MPWVKGLSRKQIQHTSVLYNLKTPKMYSLQCRKFILLLLFCFTVYYGCLLLQVTYLFQEFINFSYALYFYIITLSDKYETFPCLFFVVSVQKQFAICGKFSHFYWPIMQNSSISPATSWIQGTNFFTLKPEARITCLNLL